MVRRWQRRGGATILQAAETEDVRLPQVNRLAADHFS